jgi:hypothetical protein
MPGRGAITESAARTESGSMNKRKEQTTKTPEFLDDDHEAKWWASAEGPEFLKQQSAASSSSEHKESALVANLSRAAMH